MPGKNRGDPISEQIFLKKTLLSRKTSTYVWDEYVGLDFHGQTVITFFNMRSLNFTCVFGVHDRQIKIGIDVQRHRNRSVITLEPITQLIPSTDPVPL